MKKNIIKILMLTALMLIMFLTVANAQPERENINQTYDTTGYGSYIKVYLNKKDSMYNPVNTMAIVNTGKLHVKFQYSVTENGQGPLRVELRGYTSEVTHDKVNPYWEGWQYDAMAEKLVSGTEYSFDAVLDTKALVSGKTVQDGPYLFIAGVGSTVEVKNLELYAEGDYEEPVYMLDKMFLQPAAGVEIPYYNGEIYELKPERFDVPRTQHRIATYKNVYDFVEGTNYAVTFWYKTGVNGMKFALDTTGDPSEASGWKSVGNYESGMGNADWQKGCLSFKCSAELAENDRLYLSYHLKASSNNPETDNIYITDMILYEIPSASAVYNSGTVEKDAKGAPVVTLAFNGKPDKLSVANGLLLNGQPLSKEEAELLPAPDDRTVKIGIKKFLSPLSENNIELSECYDIFGREADLSNAVPIRFTANPHISSKLNLESYVYGEGDFYKVVPTGNFVEGATPWKHLMEYTFPDGELDVDAKICVRIKIRLTNESRGYVGQRVSLMCKDSKEGGGRTVFSETIDDAAVNGWQTMEFYFTPGENQQVPPRDTYMIYFCVSSTADIFTPENYYYMSEAEFEFADGLDVSFIKRTPRSAAVIVENHTNESINFSGTVIIVCYDSSGVMREAVISAPLNEKLEANEGFASIEVKLKNDVQSGDRITVFLLNSLDRLEPLKKQLVEYIY